MSLSPIINNHKTLIYGTPEESATFGLLTKNSTKENITFADHHSTWDGNFKYIYFLPSVLNSISTDKVPNLCIGKISGDIVYLICNSTLVLPNNYYARHGMTFNALTSFRDCYDKQYNRINFKIVKQERSNEEAENFSWRCLVEAKAAEKNKGNCHIM